jgi:hypothetical protein
MLPEPPRYRSVPHRHRADLIFGLLMLVVVVAACALPYLAGLVGAAP